MFQSVDGVWRRAGLLHFNHFGFPWEGARSRHPLCTGHTLLSAMCTTVLFDWRDLHPWQKSHGITGLTLKKPNYFYKPGSVLCAWKLEVLCLGLPSTCNPFLCLHLYINEASHFAVFKVMYEWPPDWEWTAL